MTIPSHIIERLLKVFAWIGAVATGAVAAWVATKIHAYDETRKAHLQDLKEKVLVPLRDGLEDHFRPLVYLLKPIVFVQPAATTRFDEKAKATEEPREQGDILLGAFPSAAAFGSLDSTLLEDAKKNHFVDLMALGDRFATQWVAFTGECHTWALKVSREILARSGLPKFSPTRSSPGIQPYVMHYRLAVFVYKRLFRLHAPALREYGQQGDYFTLEGEGCIIALGSAEQLKRLTEHIDQLLESEEPTARALRDKAVVLQQNFQEIMPKLDYAIASRRLRKRCDLVTFF
jgi:hypothetical protein